jgi:FtsP/CotA-like multicopper oxidase with cupredoxin domain
VRKITVATLLLMALSLPAGAVSQSANGFSIRFYDQKIYFLGDQILIAVQIENTGTDTMRFQVADNRYFSFDFDVRTTTNIALGHAREFTSQRSSDQPVFFREVSLEPGERYGIVVDLTSYIAISDAGQYVVQASFYPGLFRGTAPSSMTSNRLALNVKPPVVTAEEKAKVEAETGALLARQPLPPDQVVSWTIEARQKSQWERFYLYLDLESLLRQNPERDRIWRRSAEQQQRTMIDQFRQELRQGTISQDVTVIPTSFEIQKTTYSPSEGTVIVLERFRQADYTELKSYTYHLMKHGEFWIIDGYEVKNLGTE